MQTKTFCMMGAHPDDADILFGGTAIKLLQAGHRVVFISACDGSAGHHRMDRESLARRRKEEAGRVAERFGLEYRILPFIDGQMEVTLNNREYFIRLIRNLAPDVLITHRIHDYHADHRATSQLVQDSAYLLGVPLVCPDTPVPPILPIILHSWDSFQKPWPHDAAMVVAMDEVLEEKVEMLACHESQFFEWLPYIMEGRTGMPVSTKERRQWLIDRWMVRNKRQAEQNRDLLSVRYGERSRNIQYAETFELSEYGRCPGEHELETLFPL